MCTNTPFTYFKLSVYTRIMDKLLKENFRFHVKQRIAGNVHWLIFNNNFLLV